MRHDGGEAGNSCAAGSYIMSPTLGSGKISWSRCSRAYLHRFLASGQAACLQDRGPAEVSHLALARDQLPGERGASSSHGHSRLHPSHLGMSQDHPDGPAMQRGSNATGNLYSANSIESS